MSSTHDTAEYDLVCQDDEQPLDVAQKIAREAGVAERVSVALAEKAGPTGHPVVAVTGADLDRQAWEAVYNR